MADFSILIRPHDRIILAIREHIGAEEAVGVGGGEGVGVDEPADGRVIIAALEVVEAGLGVVIIAAVAQGVDVGDAGGISEDFRTAVVHCAVAPCIIVVERDHSARRIKDGRHVTLCVDKVIVQLRRRPVLIDHREGLAAVVIDELKSVVIAPSLPHDLAGERRVGIGRITDLLAAANTSHVIGVLHGLAAHDGLCELTPLRPVEMVVTAVVVRDRVAGGREVARLRLPLIQDVLGRTVCRHAREQIGPRGVRVAEGLDKRSAARIALCNAPDVARRVVGVINSVSGQSSGRLLDKLAKSIIGIGLALGSNRERTAGHPDPRDVAGVIVGIGEAAAVRAERVARARQTRAHPVAATVSRDAVVGIGAVIDLGLLPVLVGHRDALGRQLAQVIVAIRGRDHALARDRGRDGADRAVDLVVTVLAGVGILLPVKPRAELPRLRRHAVGVVVHVLRDLNERAFSRRLARMDEPTEAVVRYILYIVTSLTGHRVLHHSIEENPDKTPLLAIRLLLF